MLRRVSFGALLIAAMLALATQAVHAAPVAMVSDLEGKGVLITGTTRTALALLADIAPGAEIELDPGARMVALYLDGSGEYLFSGPAIIAFQVKQPQTMKGAAPQKRSILGGKGGADVRIKPVGVAQGALVMRSVGPRARIRLAEPSGTRVLQAPSEFRWHFDEPGVTYRFELSDDTGRTLFERDVQTTSLQLPGSVQLSENLPYTWVVSVRMRDGRKYSSSSDFSIVPSTLRKHVLSLKPAAMAPISERVAYAAWLEQFELKDEARKLWVALAAERPDDARLQTLARE